MKANELRVGNILNWQISQSIMQGIVTSVSTSSIVIDHKCTFKTKNQYDTYRLIPIFLTEEWLLKFGWTYHKSEECVYYVKSWGRNGIEIIVKDYHYTGFELELGKARYKLVEYVHQLQNLYFALTGTELTIN